MKIFPHAEQFASLDDRLRRARTMIAECYRSFQGLIDVMVTIERSHARKEFRRACTERI